MHLKRLEISGFKSFAKKVALDFTSPITAIVGPNGSGKSNVAEAFRFVLGEQSLKSMRGKKGEDLIWNGGSGATSKSNRASVKIVFDNKKRIFNLDFDEVVLERVVYRDSLSEYLINNSMVRLKDIAELLSFAHIGASGHHIISQGEADHILVASLRERREMIEDALGLKIYQYKKRESEKKLEKTRENIVSVESLRREIAPHLRFLSKQVEKLERAKEMRFELLELCRQYLRRERLYVQTLQEKAEEAVREPEEKLKKIEIELDLAKKNIESDPGIENKRQEIFKLEGELREVRNKKDELIRQSGRLEGEIVGLKRLVEKNKAKQVMGEGVAEIPIQEIRTVRENLEREISLLENTEEKTGIFSILENVKRIFRDFFARFEFLENKDSEPASDLSGEFSKLEEDKKELENKISTLGQTENNLYGRYEEVRLGIETAKDKNREAEKEVFRLMADQKEAYGQLGLARNELSQIKLLAEDLKREIEESALLLGREVLYFDEDETLKNEAGTILTTEEVLTEERQIQEDRLRKINRLKIRLEEVGVSGGEEVLKEYNDTKERDEFLNKELIDLKQTSDSLENLILELAEKIENEFKIGIEKINREFQNFFEMMFDGGKASIRLVDQEKRKRRVNLADLENEGSLEEISTEEEKESEIGIEIDIRLPRKNIKGLEMLSGGERALTSIALLFAISQVNPPPFIILDETDAALDESNSRKYSDMIENLAKLSQLILITHNRETMSRAGVLYGITMGSEGVSSLLSVGFEEAVAVAK